MILVIAVKKKSDIKNIDIRGKVCPMTFVHTKINLEKMEAGDIIDVILDFAPALDNIPKSCETQELAQLISIKEIPNKEKKEWIMRLKKL
jgi:tRNA 2-thiouridine synthesizing protein A